jgi:hypothetical protein
MRRELMQPCRAWVLEFEQGRKSVSPTSDLAFLPRSLPQLEIDWVNKALGMV